MLSKTIVIPQEKINEIQRKDVDMSSRRDIIIYILSNNIQIPKERFNEYQEEYSLAYVNFEKAKAAIEETYVNNNMLPGERKNNWTLDYNSNILTIFYTEDNNA